MAAAECLLDLEESELAGAALEKWGEGGGSQTGVGGGVNGGAEMDVVTHSFKRRGSTGGARPCVVLGGVRSCTVLGTCRVGGRAYF